MAKLMCASGLLFLVAQALGVLPASKVLGVDHGGQRSDSAEHVPLHVDAACSQAPTTLMHWEQGRHDYIVEPSWLQAAPERSTAGRQHGVSVAATQEILLLKEGGTFCPGLRAAQASPSNASAVTFSVDQASPFRWGSRWAPVGSVAGAAGKPGVAPVLHFTTPSEIAPGQAAHAPCRRFTYIE